VTAVLRRLRVRTLGGVLVTALLGAQVCAQPEPAQPGESVYRQGVLPSGQPLTATRDGGLRLSGADAACSNCHRRSGLGEIEGRIVIPPISGPYLFHPRAKDRDDLDLPFVDGMRADRDPYTDASLARAIREGIGADGRALSYLMPHYALDRADMALLIAYLKGMMPARVPGVTDTVLHFATIITPDADAVKRQGMLDVMNQFFTDKNAFVRAASPRLRSPHRMMFKSARRWQLHVWQLIGPPVTWEKQLREDMDREPVLAAISGLGGRNWEPVHRFCEHASLPCLFPNVDLPVVAERDFYSLYFSKGVLLEAELLAHQLMAQQAALGVRRVIQVFRADDIGEAAARALRTAAAGASFEIVDRGLSKADDQRQIAAALGGLGPHDALVLWLRPADIEMLANVPVPASEDFMSGLMGGLSRSPLPAAWRGATRIAYPFDLPEKRIIRMDYPLGWFAIRHIPVVDEQVQADTYLACGLLSETLSRMADSFMRDYLVERIEGMLEHRIITGYYPRLALAPNERFASKGGYIVHFAQPSGMLVSADTDWFVP
jgi:hypothetical protein